MFRLNNILVPRDFSPCSEQALRHALALAGPTGATVHLLFAEVLHADPYAPSPGHDRDRDVFLKRLTENIPEGDTVALVPALVRDVAPGSAIVQYAEDHDIDLVVLGTHGRRGLRRLLLGSTAEEVVRTAPCPVLTVRTGAKTPEAPRMDTILAPIDFSTHAEDALRYARELAGLFGARLDLLHVVEDQFHPAFYGITVSSIYDIDPDIDKKVLVELEKLYASSDGPEVEATFHVRNGQPARQIAAYAEETGSDLIVMATHGLRGLDHFLLGSVAEKVVRRATCPVFTVKSFGKDLLSAATANAEQRAT